MIMNLEWNDMQYRFVNVALTFLPGTSENVFAEKNNKTVAQTIAHRKYIKLATETKQRYSNNLNSPLGDFLMSLKRSGDQFYSFFLNPHGDLTYSKFSIQNCDVIAAKGLYIYTVEGQLQYIGRCKNSFGKRINQGYGKIHPKNCYRDGQSPNCRINAQVTRNRESVKLLVCQLDVDDEIVASEAGLISKYRPPWNIQRA